MLCVCVVIVSWRALLVSHTLLEKCFLILLCNLTWVHSGFGEFAFAQLSRGPTTSNSGGSRSELTPKPWSSCFQSSWFRIQMCFRSLSCCSCVCGMHHTTVKREVHEQSHQFWFHLSTEDCFRNLVIFQLQICEPHMNVHFPFGQKRLFTGNA